MLRLLTDAEVIDTYGDVLKFVQDDGTLTPMWAATQLVRFNLPKPLPYVEGGIVKRILCHRLVARDLLRIFTNLSLDPEVWSTINDYGGCFVFRRNRNNPRALSRHAWGIAVDLDVRDNPNRGAANMDPRVVAAFAAEGWVWGGTFGDPMHFEKGAVA